MAVETVVPSQSDHAASPAVCDACPHERSSHDRIGVRYCAATATSGLDRGCLCSVTTAGPSDTRWPSPR